ncbi:ABC transporter ATP-binding protein [uncultured Thiothrix sp.]|uniref:ABC transporter ATP-binding protein n=1 Tax=uncultured Thiothrix sp. TaxID=223185 RepID=UPI00262E864E|nr:ABC transporter ATP-binding protein [uncultured Thiothrix sp.]
MSTPILELTHIEVLYNQVILAVKDISLTVYPQQIVALLGANGAGKSTTLKAISNLVRAERGEVTKGQISYKSQLITHTDPAKLVRQGLVQVLEGRHCFGHLTVEENLKTGALPLKLTKAQLDAQLARIYTYFPRLKTRRFTQAGYTSGGEQQMVAIGRALMAQPQMILLDEPSMGLAPQIVEEIFEIIQQLRLQEGTSFLLAEQNAAIALHYADYAYVLETGKVNVHGKAEQLSQNPELQASYLGAAFSVAA